MTAQFIGLSEAPYFQQVTITVTLPVTAPCNDPTDPGGTIAKVLKEKGRSFLSDFERSQTPMTVSVFQNLYVVGLKV